LPAKSAIEGRRQARSVVSRGGSSGISMVTVAVGGAMAAVAWGTDVWTGSLRSAVSSDAGGTQATDFCNASLTIATDLPPKLTSACAAQRWTKKRAPTA